MTSHAVMTFTGEVAYATNIQSHFEPPMSGRSDSTMTQEAKGSARARPIGILAR
jgi:hypothetical protein